MCLRPNVVCLVYLNRLGSSCDGDMKNERTKIITTLKSYELANQLYLLFFFFFNKMRTDSNFIYSSIIKDSKPIPKSKKCAQQFRILSIPYLKWRWVLSQRKTQRMDVYEFSKPLEQGSSGLCLNRGCCELLDET